MVKIVKVSGKKKKETKGSKEKKVVKVPKAKKVEIRSTFEEPHAKIITGEAKWATPPDVKEENFDVDTKEEGYWANPKGAKKEYFGPVGKGNEKEEEKKEKRKDDRVKTGIKGLDEILHGGIPRKNLVTVSGGPGSGKTILCLQYIYNGAKLYKEPGVFISLEEEPDRLIKTAESFGWDIKEMIKKNKIIIRKVPLYKFAVLKNIIRDSVHRIDAKRLVIDPGALFDLFFEREIEVRKAMVELGSMLKDLGCTTIITTEEKYGKEYVFNQSDFSSDGIIFTYYTKVSNEFMRMIAIIKMRGTSHSEKIHPLRFTSNGLEVLANEEVFQDVSGSSFR